MRTTGVSPDTGSVAGNARRAMRSFVSGWPARMTRLGKAELVTGELLSVDESLDRIRAVTATQVQDLAADLAARPRSVVRVGPFGD